MTPRLPLGPQPCKPVCLGREPKAKVVTCNLRKITFTLVALNLLTMFSPFGG